MKIYLVIGIVIVILGLAAWGIWHLVMSAYDIKKKLWDIKDRAVKADNKDELQKIYDDFKIVHKECWHRELHSLAKEVHTYMQTKFDYISEDKPTDILSVRQIQRVLNFYDDHKEMVDKMMTETDKSFPPSQPEDKVDPSIWKPGYWNWFMMFEQKTV